MSYYKVIINEKGNIAVDDTILVKGYPTEAGSKILSGFTPLFSAEAVERLEKKGYVIAGKSKVGEFGLDLYGETAVDSPVLSAGACLVRENKVKANLSVDLNGYPRRAAKMQGIKFIKPSYGTVSRYGVIPCACSGEQIGVMANTTEDLIEVLSVISGHDDKDGTSLMAEKYDYTPINKAFNVAIIKELKTEETESAIKTLTEKGVAITEISIPEVKEYASAWQILMSAETTNNLSRYDGVKFGYRTENYNDIDDLYVNTRTEGFGLLAKATIVYGSNVLSKGKYFECYDKALKIRKIVMNKMAEIFASFDAVLLGVCSNKTHDGESAFLAVLDEMVYTAIASITGLPALVTNGVQFIANYDKENILFGISNLLDK